eukprot:CAMPEP_0113306446 /NCGR_PEP_ID=MMETSP0010_2-20120614/5694_1 /TAXON_ID=216773 ORGANISM="Corethron hystrix, Strain 308" /NCGR_SAMPLE_ID=MMETSP0010_2 /ASSEMBLY_ACC=CAM_ASM_000155 /LENGTH=828 /DNA_ID=CAMNT_0000161115 /DNA_START=268 /DNA_END=2754 /DNA_ORIENTATION=+ /assembly_acc=CAM_ASM_000155
MIFPRSALTAVAALLGSARAFSPSGAFVPSSRNILSSSGISSGSSRVVNNNVASFGLHMSTTVEDTATQVEEEDAFQPMRPPDKSLTWDNVAKQLSDTFGYSDEEIASYASSRSDRDSLLKLYRTMQECRGFENACNQNYMQGKIRGFMHLDNGQESIPGLVADSIKNGDKKYSYYREHTHALASGVDPGAIMAELFMKDGGTCRGAGGSMHIFDKPTNFQGGWALVSEQLPYACGAAKSILLDRELGLSGDDGKVDVAPGDDDDRISVVFIGEGGSQNGRMAETLNAAAKDGLPLLVIVIDNGRAINTFTQDVAQNSDIYKQGQHYGVPGLKVDGTKADEVLAAGRAVIDHVRTKGPAVLQIHTYRFMGHSPADPEHERGRKDEKKWARDSQDPIKHFENKYVNDGTFTQEELDDVRKEALVDIKAAVKFADESPFPDESLAKELEFPDAPDTDYNKKIPPTFGSAVNARTISPEQNAVVTQHITSLRAKAEAGEITIGDAINLAIHEEMMRDPTTTIHAEDLQAGSSYDIPKLTQQTYGQIRAADEIIDEGHFIGKALGEGMNGYRPIVELMNTNFGIYGMAEISSAGNTFATTGGAFDMPMTIIGAGGTAPNQSLGAEHSQPFHAYVMGIPGLKICTASSPDAAYGITKSMIRDNGPCFLFAPVKMMKESKGTVDLDKCLPLNTGKVLHKASDEAVANNKAITVLTYLHGVKEALSVIDEIKEEGMDIDLIELRALKPLDVDTIAKSLDRTHKLAILDESTRSGGVGATVSAIVAEDLFDKLDAPVKRLSMDDAPVPYATTMEKGVVKRGSDLVDAVFDLGYNNI